MERSVEKPTNIAEVQRPKRIEVGPVLGQKQVHAIETPTKPVEVSEYQKFVRAVGNA